MPGVPSNRTCERCKKRHMKCDDTRPRCKKCTDAGVECPGYAQTRKFIDQGASVRRRYAPYQENVSKPSTERQVGRTEYQPTLETDQKHGSGLESGSSPESPRYTHPEHRPVFDPVDSGWNDTQRIHQISDQSADDPIIPLVTNTARGPMPSQGPGATIQQPSITPEDVRPDADDAMPQQEHQLSTHSRLLSSRSTSQRGEREEFQDIFSELMTGTEHEISFLVRHYCEALAPWLDISDASKFFAASVPVRALDEHSLRFAIAALSSKHLAKWKGVKFTATDGMFTSPATMETYPNAQQVNWSLKAANYYYLAVSNMASVISDYAAVSSSDVLETPISAVIRWVNLQVRRAEPGSDPAHGAWKTTENLLGSSTILTLYKILDEPGENWQSYLTGVKSLFKQLMDFSSQASGRAGRFSPGVTAAFWNFARLDYLSSYYNRSPTHFDADDFALWRAAGLSLDDYGKPCSPEMVPTTQAFSQEDIATNSLTRLLNKLTNFLAACKKSQLEHWVGQPSPEPSNSSQWSPHSPDSHPTTEAWLKLSFEFQSWVERIPETFRPCLRLERPKLAPTMAGKTSHMPFPEIFYSLPSCAAAMQQYHFGRLALSLNRPSDDIAGPSTAFDRLQGYRDLTKEVDHRCREICGIALARPQSGVRVQMITLLYAVGQCLEKPEEKLIVVDLLRGIEADLGWSTASQVQKLQR
ncbi:hypothetical protein BDW62DRAFT_189406 [Aspergillus aurantiobrunneus]